MLLPLEKVAYTQYDLRKKLWGPIWGCYGGSRGGGFLQWYQHISCFLVFHTFFWAEFLYIIGLVLPDYYSFSSLREKLQILKPIGVLITLDKIGWLVILNRVKSKYLCEIPLTQGQCFPLWPGLDLYSFRVRLLSRSPALIFGQRKYTTTVVDPCVVSVARGEYKQKHWETRQSRKYAKNPRDTEVFRG